MYASKRRREHDDRPRHDHDHHHHDGPHDYVAAIQGYRAEKDEFFKTSAGSPIPPGERDAFTGLPYYPVNVYQPTIFHWLNYAAMARDTGATVVVPLYPLAPQGTAATDVPAMADLISSQIDQHEAENVSVYVDSSGGGLALAAVQELVRRGDPRAVAHGARFTAARRDVQ